MEQFRKNFRWSSKGTTEELQDQIQWICWRNSGRIYVRTSEKLPVNLRRNFQEIAERNSEELLEELRKNLWKERIPGETLKQVRNKSRRSFSKEL